MELSFRLTNAFEHRFFALAAAVAGQVNNKAFDGNFYRTRIRSLALLVTNSLTDSALTHSRLVSLFDVTLACEDAYSKLVQVVTVADVSDEDRVGNSLLLIWELRFGHKANFFRYCQLSTRVDQDFEFEVQARF